MSNCCSPRPDYPKAYFETRHFDVPALQKVVDWSKSIRSPEFPKDMNSDSQWATYNACAWFRDITIGPNFIEIDLRGDYSAHTFRDLNATLQLLGTYSNEDLEVEIKLMDDDNPRFGYQRMRYRIGPAQGWARPTIPTNEG